MSELKKAKYLGGIGASGIMIIMVLAAIIDYLIPGAVFSEEALAGLGVIGIVSFIFLFLAVKKIGKISGKKEIFREFLLAIGSLGLLIPIGGVGFLVGGLCIIIAEHERMDWIMKLICDLPIFAGLATFLLSCYFFFRVCQRLTETTRKKLFLWASIIIFLTPFSFIPYIYILSTKQISYPYPYLLGFFGFLLLTIAFFTLPENLPQKSSTEKKEV